MAKIKLKMLADFNEDADGNLMYKGKPIGSGGSGSGGTFTGLAKDITVEDIDNNFTSSPKNVESILKELFSLVTNRKDMLGSALSDKGMTITGTESFADMIAILRSLPTSLSKTKLNITAPFSKEIILNNQILIDDLTITILKVVFDETNKLNLIANFDNSDSINFIKYGNIIFGNGKATFDNSVGFTQYADNIECAEIDTATYVDFKGINYNEVNNSFSIDSKYNNGMLVGKGFIDIRNTVINSFIFSGTCKVAISFNNGDSWFGIKDGKYVEMMVTDIFNLKDIMMTETQLNAISKADIESIRNGNSLKMAYYFEDGEYTDTISINVNTNGRYEIAPTTDYNLRVEGNKILLNFLTSGTYTINYMNN